MGLDIAQERAALAEKKRKEAEAAEKLAKKQAQQEAALAEKKRKEAEAREKFEKKLTEKQEEQKLREDIAEINRQIPLSKSKPVSSGPIIDCGACKTPAAMSPTEVPRFGGFIRFLGYLVVIPSVLGFALSLLFFSVFAVVPAAISLIGGLVGYLLLTKKKVLLCRVCGYILDRA